MDAKAKVEKYAVQSQKYLRNASKSIDAGDSDKASEFLWGSMAEALKAVALSKGKELNNHWNIGDYAKKLAKQIGDESILDVYGTASYLHSNFYEAGLSLEEVQTYAERIRATVGKLLSFIYEESEKNQGS